jgi:hypothetical protein
MPPFHITAGVNLLCTPNKVHLGVFDRLTEGLAAIQIIAQDRDVAFGIVFAMRAQPTLARFNFAVLLFVSILRHNKFRF